MNHASSALLGSLLLVVPATAQEDDANSRVDKLLSALSAPTARLSTMVTKNPAYDARRRAAGARLTSQKQFVLRTFRDGDVSIWIAEEVVANGGKPERHILARKGARWIHKEHGEQWEPCLRPSGVWQTAFLLDIGFLADSLRELLPKTKWKAETATKDDRPLRLFAAELAADQVNMLLRRGAMPESSDYMTGLGLIGRRYMGRVVRLPDRTAKVRIFVGPKSSTTKIELDLYQQGGAAQVFAAGGVAIRVAGGGALPANPGQKKEKKKDDNKDDAEEEENPPSLRVGISLQDPAKAPADLLDATARALLDKQ